MTSDPDADVRSHAASKLLAFAERPTGQVAVSMLAFVLLAWLGTRGPESALSYLWVIVACALPPCVAWPSRRNKILSVATVAAVLEFHLQRRGMSLLGLRHAAEWVTHTADITRATAYAAATLGGLVGASWCLRRLPSPALPRHPVLALHALLWCVLAAIPVFRLPLGIAAVIAFVAWRLSYMVLSAKQGGSRRSRLSDQLFTLWPVYGPNQIPTTIGKGYDYLSKRAQAGREALARCRLSGLRLLVLALLWQCALDSLDTFVYGNAEGIWRDQVALAHTLGLPRLHEMMDRRITSPHTVLANLYLELVRTSLYIATYGHTIVGCLRLLGFDVKRHTHGPLFSKSIVEFWNRWTYYYKELLNDFFFLPTYVRCRFLGFDARLFVAVFAAAAVGNMYFEILWHADVLLSGSVPESLWSRWESRAVYCALLAFGIWISMKRQLRIRAAATTSPPRAARFQQSFLVCSFYAIVHVWNVGQSHLGPLERLAWLLSVVLG